MSELQVLEAQTHAENMTTAELISKYQEIEFMKKDLLVREKYIKNAIIDRIKETDNKFEDDKFQVGLKSFESKRLNTKLIKQLIEDSGQGLDKFQTISKSERLNIKRLFF